ncbi:hypothetical protein HanPI659440_Chr08g0283591 [Helianthus annuus]|nr:hypothetical protein HanPI659440_Chr08g0283591 [Helianthus annuus]
MFSLLSLSYGPRIILSNTDVDRNFKNQKRRQNFYLKLKYIIFEAEGQLLEGRLIKSHKHVIRKKNHW